MDINVIIIIIRKSSNSTNNNTNCLAANFAGSTINENGMNHLAKVLRPSKTNPVLLIDLNLKQTFLSTKQLNTLSDALRLNQTLIKLNLSHNYISDV